MLQSAFKIESTIFRNGDNIPEKFTADGENISPPLTWANVPHGTKELVLICEDPDSVGTRPFVHWILYKIPANLNNVEAGMPQKAKSATHEFLQGKNSAGMLGYYGPKPPATSGAHRYYFKLYALDEKLNVPEGLSKAELLEAMRSHVIGETEFMGKYQYH